MTPHPQPDKYLLITAEELLIVEHGCIYPDKNECVGKLCKYHDPNPSFRDNIVCLLNEHDVADNVRYRPHTPAPAPVVDILTLLEETVDNWWRTYNSLDFDCYRRTKPKEKGLKHHHNMRTHVYKKYKMFFDYCKTPEGIQRMQEFNRKAKEYITIRSTQQQEGDQQQPPAAKED